MKTIRKFYSYKVGKVDKKSCSINTPLNEIQTLYGLPINGRVNALDPNAEGS